jgi:hypothetical protein
MARRLPNQTGASKHAATMRCATCSWRNRQKIASASGNCGLQRLGEEDFIWLQIAAASDQPICSFMVCNGLADPVAKQLVALEAIEREVSQDGAFKAQDRRLNVLMVILTAITTVVGLGSLSISYLAHRRSRGLRPTEV